MAFQHLAHAFLEVLVYLSQRHAAGRAARANGSAVGAAGRDFSRRAWRQRAVTAGGKRGDEHARPLSATRASAWPPPCQRQAAVSCCSTRCLPLALARCCRLSVLFLSGRRAAAAAAALSLAALCDRGWRGDIRSVRVSVVLSLMLAAVSKTNLGVLANTWRLAGCRKNKRTRGAGRERIRIAP